MHQLENRTYAGAPGERATITTEVHGGGAVTVTIDGVKTGANPAFPLKPNPGDETHMAVALIGAVGDSCVVRIRDVDGGSDGDLLLCQSLDPAPIHRFRFIVAAARAMASLQDAMQPGPAPAATESAAAKSPGKTGKKAKRGKK